MKNKLKVILAILVFPLVMQQTYANDYTVLVAPKSSEAYEYAESIENTEGILSIERKLHRAFESASNKLTNCGTCTVNIKIAAGIYAGKAKTGTWFFPDTQAPNSNLRILGGYDETFEYRDPFEFPTILQVSENRSAPVLSFEGKKHALDELIVSGLVIDVGPSNAYDSKSNSQLKGGSSSWPILSFGYLTTDRLTISDNVFLNASNGVGDPRIRAKSAEAEVQITNNIFYNNVFTWGVNSGGGKNMMSKYVFHANSFIMNWPYNFDTGTAEPGAINIGNKNVAEQVVIQQNIFAYNVGGAIHPKWDDKAGPAITIDNNLFYKNGAMFNPQSVAAGALVGKFNGSGVHAIFDTEDLKDDFDWTVNGNVSNNPGLVINDPDLTNLSRQNSQRGVPENQQPNSLQSSNQEQDDTELDAINDELAALMNDDEAGDSFSETDNDGVVDGGIKFEKYLVESDIMDDQGTFKNYAPYVPFEVETLPFPDSSNLNQIGASSEHVIQY